MNTFDEAITFATLAHSGQERKYTREAYISHPLAVANMVRSVGAGDSAVIAAILHDVVEDTHVTLQHISEKFGPLVGYYVDLLSDPAVTGNRAARKAYQAGRLAGAPSEVQTIKLADLIDNTKSIVEHDRKFAKVYLREAFELLYVLTRGDLILLDRACDMMNAAIDELDQPA